MLLSVTLNSHISINPYDHHSSPAFPGLRRLLAGLRSCSAPCTAPELRPGGKTQVPSAASNLVSAVQPHAAAHQPSSRSEVVYEPCALITHELSTLAHYATRPLMRPSRATRPAAYMTHCGTCAGPPTGHAHHTHQGAGRAIALSSTNALARRLPGARGAGTLIFS